MTGRYFDWRGAIRYVALLGVLWLLGLGVAHVVEWWAAGVPSASSFGGKAGRL